MRRRGRAKGAGGLVWVVYRMTCPAATFCRLFGAPKGRLPDPPAVRARGSPAFSRSLAVPVAVGPHGPAVIAVARRVDEVGVDLRGVEAVPALLDLLRQRQRLVGPGARLRVEHEHAPLLRRVDEND